MSGGSFSRKMYQLKSHVGAANKTLDTEVQFAKNKLNDINKKFKNIQTVIKKLSPTLHATNLMQVEVLTSLKDVLDSSNSMTMYIDNVTTTFQRLDEGVAEYEQKIENDILIPMKQYAEQLKTMEKRFDICHTRRVDMDRFHDKVLDISKKPPGKQVGLAEVQAKYNKSRDLYNYLRSELLVDMENISRSFDEVVGPTCTILITAYTNYINHINNNWERAIDVCPNFKYDTINVSVVITSMEETMALEQNVINAKARDVEDGTYQMKKMKSSSSNSSDDQKKKPAATPAKRPPPPAPTKRKEQVKCEYEYTAQEQGELSFREGDIITVLKKEGDWWLGELRGQQGLFPYNYVTPI